MGIQIITEFFFSIYVLGHRLVAWPLSPFPFPLTGVWRREEVCRAHPLFFIRSNRGDGKLLLCSLIFYSALPSAKIILGCVCHGGSGGAGRRHRLEKLFIVPSPHSPLWRRGLWGRVDSMSQQLWDVGWGGRPSCTSQAPAIADVGSRLSDMMLMEMNYYLKTFAIAWLYQFLLMPYAICRYVTSL